MTNEHDRILDVIKDKITSETPSMQSAITWFDNLFILGEALRRSRKIFSKIKRWWISRG